jgi:hypothetical protein
MNIRKMLLTFAIGLLSAIHVFAQAPSPVKWSHKMEYGKGDEVTLVFVAEIEKGWHLYSQDLPEGGPIKTTFVITPGEQFEISGPVTEGKATDFYDKNFEMQLKYFSGTAEFRQKIRIKSGEAFQIPASVEYMVCDDLRCLPPVMFNFEIPVSGLKSTR